MSKQARFPVPVHGPWRPHPGGTAIRRACEQAEPALPDAWEPRQRLLRFRTPGLVVFGRVDVGQPYVQSTEPRHLSHHAVAVGDADERPRAFSGVLPHLHHDVQVLAHRVRDPGVVAPELLGVAASNPLRLVALRARARAHRRNELEPGGQRA